VGDGRWGLDRQAIGASQKGGHSLDVEQSISPSIHFERRPEFMLHDSGRGGTGEVEPSVCATSA